MFGTLIVQLPSVYSGGELVMHLPDGDETCTMGAEGESRHAYYFAAHYADLKHSIKPLTSGIRLAATYSLCWKGSGTAPSLDQVLGENDPFVEVAKMDSSADDYVVLPLAYEYTESAITSRGLAALKGSDAHFVEQLRRARDTVKGEFDLLLMTASREEFYYSMADSSDWENADWELSDNREYNRTFDEEGTKVLINFELPDDFQWENGRDEGISYTGNEGAEKTKFYQKTFLVFSPRLEGVQQEIRLHGVEKTIRQTLELVRNQKVPKEEKSKKLRQLSTVYLESHRAWASLFTAIVELGDPEIARAFVMHQHSRIPPSYLSDMKQLVSLLPLWSDKELQETLRQMFQMPYSRVDADWMSGAQLLLALYPAEPTREQTNVMSNWIDAYCTTVVSKAATLSSPAIRCFLQVCARSSKPLEFVNVFVEAIKQNLPASVSSVLRLDSHLTSLPEWRENVASLHEPLLRLAATGIRHSREEGELIYFLRSVDDFPDREQLTCSAIDHPVWNGVERLHSLLENCYTLKNSQIKVLAERRKQSLRAEIRRYEGSGSGWTMPDALVSSFYGAVPSDDLKRDLLQFLHGPNQSFVVAGHFGSIKRARSFKVLGTGFSLRYGNATGTGPRAQVEIHKTTEYRDQWKDKIATCRTWLDRLCRQYPDAQQKTAPRLPIKRDANIFGDSADAPPSKKSAQEFIDLSQ